MPNFDRRHATAVARRVCDALGAEATPAVLAAALLHDVGKIDSGFGVWRRAGATVWIQVRGLERVGGRVAAYARHPEIGAALLREAGADPLTAAWAAEHHLAPERWTIPAGVGAALKAADDD